MLSHIGHGIGAELQWSLLRTDTRPRSRHGPGRGPLPLVCPLFIAARRLPVVAYQIKGEEVGPADASPGRALVITAAERIARGLQS